MTMPNREAAFLLILSFVCLFHPPPLACGQAGPTEAPKLRYKVELGPNPTVAVAKPVMLRVHLINEGAAPVTVFWPAEPYLDVFRFQVARKDGGKIPMPDEPRARLALPKEFKEIAPGGEVTYSIVWDMPHSSRNCQEFAFTEPGDYVIRASFASPPGELTDSESGNPAKIAGVWKGIVEAEPLTVTVKPNRTAADGRVRLDGKAIGKGGEPVPQVLVTVKKQIRSMGSHSGLAMVDCARGYTAADGSFSFEWLPEDSPFLEVQFRHPQYCFASENVVLDPPKMRYELRVELDPGLTVRGVVRDADGKPLAGAKATDGHDRYKSTYTDDSGRFELHGVKAAEEILCSVGRDGWIGGNPRVPPALATGGDWVVTLRRKQNLSFSGRAVFADGTPAANLVLSFYLKPNAGGADFAGAETDAEGRFTATLHKPETYSGEVWARVLNKARTPTASQWKTTVKEVAPGVAGLNLVFENRGAITAAVAPAGPLPASVEFAVRCSIAGPPDGRWETVETKNVGAKGGIAQFEKLSPGKYRIEVVVLKAEHWTWKREVELTAGDDGRKAALRFPLPELSFGNLRARVLLPDGKTALDKGSAWMDGAASWGRVDIVDGRIELNDVPAGKMWLTIQKAQGFAAKKASGVVLAGQTTDLGDIVLEREEDATGWVEGRVVYEDGGAALGAALCGQMPMGTPVEDEGHFRVQLAKGKQTIAVDLTNALRWPNAEAAKAKIGAAGRGGMSIQAPRDIVLADVEVIAGKTVTRDITLSRANLGKIEVNWQGKSDGEKPTLFFKEVTKRSVVETSNRLVVIVEGKDQRIVRTLYLLGAPSTHQALTDVPAGDKVVILNVPGYCGYKEIPADKNDAVVIFDPAEVGTIERKALRPDGTPAARVSVSLKPAPQFWSGAVQGPAISFLGAQTGEDGAFRISGVAAGRYTIEVPGGQKNAPQVAEVAAGKTVTFDLVADAPSAASPSSGPPPLRDEK